MGAEGSAGPHGLPTGSLGGSQWAAGEGWHSVSEGVKDQALKGLPQAPAESPPSKAGRGGGGIEPTQGFISPSVRGWGPRPLQPAGLQDAPSAS